MEVTTNNENYNCLPHRVRFNYILKAAFLHFRSRIIYIYILECLNTLIAKVQQPLCPLPDIVKQKQSNSNVFALWSGKL